SNHEVDQVLLVAGRRFCLLLFCYRVEIGFRRRSRLRVSASEFANRHEILSLLRGWRVDYGVESRSRGSECLNGRPQCLQIRIRRAARVGCDESVEIGSQFGEL